MKKTKQQVLEEKYETALVQAGRFDVFGILEKMNRKRQRKKGRLLESLDVEVGEVDEFEVPDWKPKVLKR